MVNDTQRTMNLLGYAGLMPFFLVVLVLAFSDHYTQQARIAADSYAFAIVCFLTGTWWGNAISSSRSVVLVLSNLLFLLAFFTFWLLPAWWTLIAAGILVLLFGLEQKREWFPELSTEYRLLRATLSLAAAASMLIIWLLA